MRNVSYFFVIKRTEVKINGISKDFGFSLLCGCVFFPISVLLKEIVDGWFFVGLTCFLGGSIYVLLQFLLKNNSVVIVKNAVTSKLKGKIKK